MNKKDRNFLSFFITENKNNEIGYRFIIKFIYRCVKKYKKLAEKCKYSFFIFMYTCNVNAHSIPVVYENVYIYENNKIKVKC